jgi:hypothetical protein
MKFSVEQIRAALAQGNGSETITLSNGSDTKEVKRMAGYAAMGYLLESGESEISWEGECPCMPGCHLYPKCAETDPPEAV